MSSRGELRQDISSRPENLIRSRLSARSVWEVRACRASLLAFPKDRHGDLSECSCAVSSSHSLRRAIVLTPRLSAIPLVAATLRQTRPDQHTAPSFESSAAHRVYV